MLIVVLSFIVERGLMFVVWLFVVARCLLLLFFCLFVFVGVVCRCCGLFVCCSLFVACCPLCAMCCVGMYSSVCGLMFVGCGMLRVSFCSLSLFVGCFVCCGLLLCMRVVSWFI